MISSSLSLSFSSFHLSSPFYPSVSLSSLSKSTYLSACISLLSQNHSICPHVFPLLYSSYLSLCLSTSKIIEAIGLFAFILKTFSFYVFSISIPICLSSLNSVYLSLFLYLSLSLNLRQIFGSKQSKKCTNTRFKSRVHSSHVSSRGDAVNII